MPKLIDRDARRTDLVRAAGYLIANAGVHAATVRAVADRLRLTPSSVRHIFPSQTELLSAVLEDFVAQVEAGVQLRDSHYRKEEMAPSRLGAILPIAENARHLWRLDRALRLSAGRDVELSRASAACHRARAFECRIVLQLMAAQLAVPDSVMEFEGRRVLALLEGLGEQLCADAPAVSSDQARYILRTHLEGAQQAWRAEYRVDRHLQARPAPHALPMGRP